MKRFFVTALIVGLAACATAGPVTKEAQAPEAAEPGMPHAQVVKMISGALTMGYLSGMLCQRVTDCKVTEGTPRTTDVFNKCLSEVNDNATLFQQLMKTPLDEGVFQIESADCLDLNTKRLP